ncbi:hypothetical protein FA15DRAFT_175084 [Coprinopsis marcescibilis]|uniref:Uncharacterized protein n=1 Tax=Coprinopsis marcescibilis TaxID=230819 RepID=A0A5C3KGX5_COPMA|nr:hypothetical protein FA15DRAFT_175084 [Coprinopsis marcescibilis]
MSITNGCQGVAPKFRKGTLFPVRYTVSSSPSQPGVTSVALDKHDGKAKYTVSSSPSQPGITSIALDKHDGKAKYTVSSSPSQPAATTVAFDKNEPKTITHGDSVDATVRPEVTGRPGVPATIGAGECPFVTKTVTAELSEPTQAGTNDLAANQLGATSGAVNLGGQFWSLASIVVTGAAILVNGLL